MPDELNDFAFDYAYELYFAEDVICSRRLEFEEVVAKGVEERRR